MQIVQYQTEEEKQQIIAEKTAIGLHLIEIQNITEGNFLGFDDHPNPRPIMPNEVDELTKDKVNMQEIMLDIGIRLQMLEMEV